MSGDDYVGEKLYEIDRLKDIQRRSIHLSDYYKNSNVVHFSQYDSKEDLEFQLSAAGCNKTPEAPVSSSSTRKQQLVQRAFTPQEAELDFCISAVSPEDVDYVNGEISRNFDGQKARVTFACPGDAKPGLVMVFEEAGWNVNTKTGLLLVWELSRKK